MLLLKIEFVPNASFIPLIIGDVIKLLPNEIILLVYWVVPPAILIPFISAVALDVAEVKL